MASVLIKVKRKAKGSGNWGHLGRPGLVGGSKGGPGSGHWGHAGLPGQVGGSTPGKGSWKESPVLSDTWRSNYTEYLRRGTIGEIPNSWEHFEKVRSGVKANPQRSEDGFGLCALHSMNAAKADPSLQVYGGIMLDKSDIKDMEDSSPMQYWGGPRVGTIHVWNVDSAGRVVDHAAGSRNAGKIYIGLKLDINKFSSDGDLLSYVRDSFKIPRVDNAAMYEQWKLDRAAYVKKYGEFSERL